MRISVFGATGGTGREIVQQALDAGRYVTAFARPTANMPFGSHERMHIVTGDLSRPELIDEALAEADAVITALGTNAKGPVSVCTDGLRAILAGMERQGVRRLVAVSAHGAAQSRDRSIYSMMLWATLGHKMRDKDGMEALIRASNTDWTIVRPPRLTDGPHTGNYSVGENIKIGVMSRISRADLANYVLTLAAGTMAIGETPKVAL